MSCSGNSRIIHKMFLQFQGKSREDLTYYEEESITLWPISARIFNALEPVHTTPEKFENGQQSPVIVDLCLGKIRGGKSHYYREVFVFEKLLFQNVFRPHSGVFKFPPVWRAFSGKLRFRDGLLRTGRPNHRNIAAFSNSSGLKSVFVKLHFHDGLVWTVDKP